MSRDSEGEDDELSSPSISSLRVTPRPAIKRSASEALGNGSTPFTNLRKLASTIRATSSTPNAQRRAPSVSAASDSKVGGTTATLRRYGASGVGRYPRPVPAKRSAPSTPHAIRALEQRRKAALTPSREQRRRSGRQQRDSPRDILRNLSRLLAAKIPPPPPETPPAQTEADLDESEDELQDDQGARPRLSLPIDEDDSFQLPPEISALDDVTSRSIEASRRAMAEAYPGGPSRLSEGLVLTPDDKLRPVTEESFRAKASPGMSIVIDNSILPNSHQGDDTEDLRRMVFRQREDSPQDESLQSDHRIRDTGFDDSTFRFDIPMDLPGPEEIEVSALAEQVEDLPSEEEITPQGEEVSSGVEDYQPPLAGSDLESKREIEAAAAEVANSANKTKRQRKAARESHFGIPVPSLPVGVVKSVATSFLRSSGKRRKNLNRDTVAALTQATEWYFEQLGDDLSAYSKHARRKTIAEADVIALMKRQRLLSATSTPFSLAQKFLPRELQQEIRMAPPKDEVRKVHGRQKPEVADEDGEDEESEAEDN